MAFEATYNKYWDTEKEGRRTQTERDTKREFGVRLGPFEAGYRGETHTKKVDERREATRGNVKRAFRIGLQ
ncbi:MAG: hypothetical protein AAB588_05650 [Patescibacteria group bacterium]